MNQWIFSRLINEFVVTENMAFAKIINTRKFWRCAGFVVASFGHQLVRFDSSRFVRFSFQFQFFAFYLFFDHL